MEAFSALLVICAGNSPVPGEFPAQGPVTRSFDVFFDLCLNKRLSKQSWGWWFETLSCSLWRHRNDWYHINYLSVCISFTPQLNYIMYFPSMFCFIFSTHLLSFCALMTYLFLYISPQLYILDWGSYIMYQELKTFCYVSTQSSISMYCISTDFDYNFYDE